MKKDKRYIEFYSKVESWFYAHETAFKIFKILYQYLAWPVIAAYLVLIIYSIINLELLITFKVVLVPFTAFVVVSIFRNCIDSPRPYTKYPIHPLMYKEKKGESMPSRHMLSVTIIAMVWLYVYEPAGIILWLLSLVMGTLRVLAGVHFLKDIIAAALISIFFGYVGLWLL